MHITKQKEKLKEIGGSLLIYLQLTSFLIM